jgi:hypothetical protein
MSIEFGYRAIAEKYHADPVMLARLDRVREVFLQRVKEEEMSKWVQL